MLGRPTLAMRTLAASGALCALGACTTTSFELAKVDLGASRTAQGVPYDLPMTQYEIEITRRIKDCTNNLTGVTKAEIKAVRVVADPAHMYAVDPTRLTNWMKTSDFKVEYYPSGGVRAVNASVEDQAGPVIANVVGGAVKLVVLTGAGGAGGGKGVNVCSVDVQAAMAKIPGLMAALGADKAEVSRWTAPLAAATAKAAKLSGNVDDATRRELRLAADALEAASVKMAGAKDDLQEQLDVITDVRSEIWPEAGDDFAKGPVQLPASVLRTWTGPKVSSIEIRKLDVHFRLERAAGFGRDPATSAHQTIASRGGLPVRRAAPGRLVVCGDADCRSENTAAVLVIKEGPVAQLGPLYSIPFQNAAFQANSLSLALDEAGGLQSVGVVQKASVAKEASAAFKDTASQLAALPGEIATARAARIKAKTEETQARRALAEAQAIAPPAGRAELLDELKLDLELAQTETKLIEAAAALEAAQATRDRP